MDFFSTPLLVTVILGAVGLAVPIIDALKKERGANNSLYCGISVGAIILVIGIIIFRILFGESIPTIEFGKSMLADDMFGSFFAITLLIVSVMVTASSWNYMKNKTNPAAYYSLILLSSIGMILIAYSTDLVMLLVAWELMSIPTYALAAFSKRDPISNEAAIKYFLFGALSSAILVLAIGLVYGVTGTTNIGEAIVSMVNVQKDLVPVTVLAVALFIAGFGFKMGLVPFHMRRLSYGSSSKVSRRSLGKQLNKPGFVFNFFLHNSLCDIISAGILAGGHITYFTPRTNSTLF